MKVDIELTEEGALDVVSEHVRAAKHTLACATTALLVGMDLKDLKVLVELSDSLTKAAEMVKELQEK